MNDQYLQDIILNFILAGKDTTANTLSWFFYMLCKNPLVQEKIVQEIRETIPGNSIDEFVTNTTDDTFEKMHYLHAALSETLRLYPVVPVVSFHLTKYVFSKLYLNINNVTRVFCKDGRCAEADDILPDGYRVKKGDNVYYIAYAMGRMTNIWGDDAKDFKPERWLNNGIFQPESPFKFIAFHVLDTF